MAWYNTKVGGWFAKKFDSLNTVVQAFIVPFGFIAVGKQMYDAQKEAQKAQEEAEKQSKRTSGLNGDVSNLPYIKGSKNTTATGQTQPYIIGRHLFTPYILNGGGGSSSGYHKIDGNYGENQYYNVVLEGGFNKQLIESLSVGDVKVADFSGDTEPQEGKKYFDSTSYFADADSFIEISQDGKGFDYADFNKKIVETESNEQIKDRDNEDYEPLIFTLDKNAMAADVTIMFNGLYAVDNNGNKKAKTRTITPEWSSNYLDLLNSGEDVSRATWHTFYFRQVYKKTITTYKTGYYKGPQISWYVRGATASESTAQRNAAKQKGVFDKSNWIFSSGDDIKNNDNTTYEVIYKTVSKSVKQGNRYLTKSYIQSTTIKVTQTITTTVTETKNSNSFTFNKQSQIRFNAHADFSFADRFNTVTDSDGNTTYQRKENPIVLRISNGDNKDEYARGDCYVQYVQSTCFNETESKENKKLVAEKVIADREAKLSTLIGICIKATKANESKLDKISVITNGLAPYLDDSGEWVKDSDGNLLKEPTSNIASWTLEILTSSTHTPSMLSLDEIDLDTFKEWYKYCEDYGLNVNKVLTAGATKESIISSLVSAGRAVLYQDVASGLLCVSWDRVQSEPKMLLNSQNMVNFSWTKDITKHPDGVKLTFVDAENNAYDTDSVIRMYEQYASDGADQWENSENRDYDAELTEIEAYGVTDRVQAYCYMDYVMRCARLRLKEASCTIGKEGAFLRPYDRVQVQHWAIGRGKGSTRVKSVIKDNSNNIIGITTTEPVMMSASESSPIYIQCTGGESVEVKSIEGTLTETRGNEIDFSSTFSGTIRVGDIVSYGIADNSESEVVVEDFIVRTVQPSGNNYTLSLTEYDERIFDIGTIPEYESPLSVNGDIRQGTLPDSTDYTAEELELLKKRTDTIEGKETSDETPSTPSVRAKAEKDGIKIYCTPYGKALADTAKGYKVILYKGDSDETGTELSSNSSEFTYSFVRSTDGYLEAETLSTWKVKAKTVNIYENESEYSVSVNVDVSDYGTWLFSAPSTIEANAVKDGINIKWTPAVPSDFYGSVSYNVSIKYNGTKRANISTATKTASYTFKRSVDGYPEKKSVYDALTDEEKEALTKTTSLGLYTVEIEAVDSVTKVSETSESVDLDDTDYETWFTPSMDSVSLIPSKDSLNAKWNVGSTATYGDIRYKVTFLYNGETLQTASQAIGNIADYVFDRDSDKDGYPEKTAVLDSLTQLGYETKGRDISLYSVKVEAYTLQVKGYTSTLTKKCSVQGYGTWLPNTNNALTINATQSGLSCEITTNPLTTEYGLPYSYEWGIKKGENAEWESFISDSAVYEYVFNEEYPEVDDLLKWQVRARPLSIAGLTSLYYKTAAPDVTSYGTWKLNKPEVATRVSDRTITLIISQPAMSAEQYGNVRYRIKIRKPSSDGTGEWFKPARTLDPYADEDNYKDGDGYIETGNVYTQTMPLTGQTNKSLCDTLYQFAVTAVNEAGVSETNDTVFETALCTNIQDIVKANETAKSAYISKLSAISANIGTIRQGTLSGNDYNYWNLSTFTDEDTKKKHWQGAMRVGGEDQYLLVKPRIKNEEIQGYDITFKVGNFEISSSASNINGELVIMESADSLDRTRISPKGTFYEHRETKDSEWNVISQMTTAGILTNALISDRSLVVTNMSVQDRRKIGHDIGRAYLSDSSRVWHFDTDLNDQNQETDLVIKKNGDVSLVGSETEGNIDFTPAILAVAPYSEIAKSLFGQYEITKTVASTAKSANVLTVDFWLQYIWCENQILFDVGTTNDKIRLAVQENEIYFNTPEEGEVVWNTEQETLGDVIVWNEPAEESSIVLHYGTSNPTPDSNNYATLTSKGVNLEPNKWLHVGIVFGADSVAVYLDKAKIEFTRYEKASDDVEIVLNKNGDTLGNTFILDELFIDSSTAEDFESFAKNTDARVPWGKLDYTSKHFVLDADRLQTNILDDLLKRVSALESK